MKTENLWRTFENPQILCWKRRSKMKTKFIFRFARYWEQSIANNSWTCGVTRSEFSYKRAPSWNFGYFGSPKESKIDFTNQSNEISTHNRIRERRHGRWKIKKKEDWKVRNGTKGWNILFLAGSENWGMGEVDRMSRNVGIHA